MPSLRSPASAALAAVLLLFVSGCEDHTWREAFRAADRGWVMHIYGLPGGTLVAAGGSPTDGRITLFDGSTATPQTLPSPIGLLNWVVAFAPDNVFVVGYEGAIVHYDGAAWTRMDSPTTQDLWGVWGATPNDVWAVGGTARDASNAVPTLLHYDGVMWTEETVPDLTPVNARALFKIWGSSATDVYAVGLGGAVIHYDGSGWSEMIVGALGDFSAVYGTGPDNVVMVGGLTNGHVTHWDGTEWRSEDLTPYPGVSGVWTRSDRVAHIAGQRGFAATIDLETFEVIEEPTPTDRQLHGVFGVDGRVYAVGGNIAIPDNATGVALSRILGDDE
ncbi:MAG: hypothetical protein AB7S26_10345 [Sandaracinaceae bacterium]